MEKIVEFIRKNKIILVSILITLFVEIFLCNYGFFRTLFSGNRNLKPKFEVDGSLIYVTDIDVKVTSINFKYKEPLIDKVTYNLEYFPEGTSKALQIRPKIILPQNEQYIKFNTGVNCKGIMIDRLTETDLQIEEIILNHPNINISLIRMFLIFIVVIFILEVRSGKFFDKEYDRNSKEMNIVFLINLTTMLVFTVLYMVCQFNLESYILKPEEIDPTDSILAQTEAIVNGQIELLEEPSEELKAMDNPYDSEKRDNEGVPYLYDVAYYDGHYYNYFGIAPILISILPFRLITGNYLPTCIFNILYIVIAVFALYGLYKKLVDKYIKKISLYNFYLGFYAILFASNIFTLFRGMKYDIVIASGIAFLLIALNLSLSIYKNPKFKILKLILLGITTALVVLSKPNLIVYYLLILFFVLCTMKDKTIKEKIKDLSFVAVPLGVLAIFQMWLNYVRFDSILEFGAQYQLSGLNVTTSMGFSINKAYAVIMEYLFRIPTINPLNFPFIFANHDTAFTAINEVCYENRLVGLAIIPILWAYLLNRDVKKEKGLKYFINVCLITSVLGMLVAGCTGGICEAYAIDFKLILSIGAVILLLKWLEDRREDKNKIFLILCITTILLMLPLSLTTESSFLSNFASNVSVALKNIFEFWA